MSASLAPLESLGSPGDVADAAIREFRNRRNLLARSRWAAFGLFVVAPLPLLVLAWAGVLLALVQIGELLSFTGDAQQGPRDYTPAHVLAGNVALLILVLAPSAGLAIVYGRIARRTARQWLWGLSACAIVALATSVATTSITFSEIPGKSTMTFGLGVGAFRWAQLWQFAVPFAAGWLSLHRTAARRPAEAI